MARLTKEAGACPQKKGKKRTLALHLGNSRKKCQSRLFLGGHGLRSQKLFGREQGVHCEREERNDTSEKLSKGLRGGWGTEIRTGKRKQAEPIQNV